MKIKYLMSVSQKKLNIKIDRKLLTNDSIGTLNLSCIFFCETDPGTVRPKTKKLVVIKLYTTFTILRYLTNNNNI